MILGEKIGKRKKRLGDLLIDAGVITQDQLAQALDKQKQTRQKLGATLMEMNFTTEEEIAGALKEQLGMEYVDLRAIRIPQDVISLIPDSALLKKYTIMPFEFNQEHSGYLRVAMADPMDLVATDDLSIITNLQIEPVVATASDIMAAIDRYYGSAETQAVAELFNRERAERYREEEVTANDEEIQNSPIVILVGSTIEQAARMRASDIHIEPLETRIRVRFRIDGMLMEHSTYPINMLSAIVARVKIIGGMDISEKRKPQDGRITHVVDRTEYDIRVSILPTVYGEKIVMRLTSKMTLTKEKSRLGFSPRELEQFDKILQNPNGIILVTGPTGSGKSTTLYTALSELNKEDVNIITVEDPVEANIDGINQVQVNPKAEMTFAAALRSILRQDPDIIMIGEIRDAETASIAVTASITGHLVVSTLHTNSAASTISRLADMGIEPYLIADATVGVIAQRLVRRLCDCKREKLASNAEKKQLGVPEQEELRICAPCGCNQCNETGYRGRIGVYEIMRVTNRLKHAISRSCDAAEIERIALADGMSTLKMSAARLVREGITSIAELKRIAYSNEDQ
ncbi:MAG: Flp pilus assembly complex ATPase component TadA [Lachnospiraceae bacterium]|nr:Flp pilus assembly complex ATPase component TadA [Lachnospiraceae bacterium]